MQLYNPATLPIDRNTSTQINISNPSKTAFMYIWGYSLTAGTAANIGFLNGNNGGVLGGYQSVSASVAVTPGLGLGSPIFTVDPNLNFVISNPNSASISGWIRISN